MKRAFLLILFLFAGPIAAATDIQTLQTPSEIKVWLVEDHNIPFVAFELRFDGGAGLDPIEKGGVTNLMMGLLEEGSGEMTAQEFAAAKESLAASFGYRANQDSVSISARFLTENRDEAIALLRQSLIAPRFDIDAVERVRAQVLTGLKANKKDPNDLVSKAFNDEAYGDHPYARDDSGTIGTVTGLSIEDLKAAHQYAMVLDRAYVSAVGDITAQELTDLVENLMAGLPETSPRPLPEQASLGLTQGVQVIDYPTPQSVALFGHAGIDREHLDFFAAYLLNQIFGGSGFESRLMREIRENRGLTYAINSYLVSRDYADVYIGQFSSANDRVAEALDVLRAEWTKMARDGITQEELEHAQTYLTGAYPLRFDGNAKIARILVGMQMQGLDPSYIKTRNDKVSAVTLEQANTVAGWLYQPEMLRIFVIGQPEGF
jgi:zinc protease